MSQVQEAPVIPPPNNTSAAAAAAPFPDGRPDGKDSYYHERYLGYDYSNNFGADAYNNDGNNNSNDEDNDD